MSLNKLIYYAAALCVLGTASLVVLLLFWNVIVLNTARAIGLNPEYLRNAAWVLALGVLLAPKRFFRIKRPTSLSATQIIFAPIEEVWDQVMPRPRSDHFLPTTPKINAVDGHEDLFEYVIPPAQSGPMKGQITLRTRVVEERAPYYLALFLENGGDVKGIGIDAESSQYRLEPIDKDTTRITFTDTVSHISPLFLMTLLFVNPARDSLHRLKAVCEGTPDMSWVGKMSAQFESGAQAEMDRNTKVIAITVTVVMTAILFGLLGLVLTVLPKL